MVVVVAFFSGIQLPSPGVMGEYVGRIHDEARQRPRFIIESRHGFDESDSAASPAQPGSFWTSSSPAWKM